MPPLPHDAGVDARTLGPGCLCAFCRLPIGHAPAFFDHEPGPPARITVWHITCPHPIYRVPPEWMAGVTVQDSGTNVYDPSDVSRETLSGTASTPQPQPTGPYGSDNED